MIFSRPFPVLIAQPVPLVNAYMEFPDWHPKNIYPETIYMDLGRIQKLEEQAFRLSCIASVITIVSSVRIIEQQTSTRLELLKQVSTLFEDISNDR